jgi:hypothetical protein
MDAYLISNFVKKSLQKKKVLEHADFLPQISSNAPSAPLAPSANQYVDNSINDFSTTNNTEVTNIIIENEDENEDEDADNEADNSASKISTGTFVLLLLINSYAAYLSWDCNTVKKYPMPLKIVFSIFAFMFGSVYVLYYMLFKFDDCNKF